MFKPICVFYYYKGYFLNNRWKNGSILSALMSCNTKAGDFELWIFPNKNYLIQRPHLVSTDHTDRQKQVFSINAWLI